MNEIIIDEGLKILLNYDPDYKLQEGEQKFVTMDGTYILDKRQILAYDFQLNPAYFVFKKIYPTLDLEKSVDPFIVKYTNFNHHEEGEDFMINNIQLYKIVNKGDPNMKKNDEEDIAMIQNKRRVDLKMDIERDRKNLEQRNKLDKNNSNNPNKSKKSKKSHS